MKRNSDKTNANTDLRNRLMHVYAHGRYGADGNADAEWEEPSF